MSYASLGVEYSAQVSTSGGASSSGGGVSSQQVSTTTKVNMTCATGYRAVSRADGSFACISDEQIRQAAAAAARIFMIQNAAQRTAASAQLSQQLQPMPAISATCADGSTAERAADGSYRCAMRAGMLSGRNLLIGGAIVAGAVLLIALKKRKAS